MDNAFLSNINKHNTYADLTVIIIVLKYSLSLVKRMSLSVFKFNIIALSFVLTITLTGLFSQCFNLQTSDKAFNCCATKFLRFLLRKHKLLKVLRCFAHILSGNIKQICSTNTSLVKLCGCNFVYLPGDDIGVLCTCLEAF